MGYAMKQLLFNISNEEALNGALGEIRSQSELLQCETVLLHAYCGNGCERAWGDADSLCESILRQVDALLPGALFVGLSSDGEILRAGLVERSVLLSAQLFKSSWARVLSFENIASRERQVGEQLLEEVESHGDLQGVEILFAGSDFDCSLIYESLNKSRVDLPFFGGYAVWHGSIAQRPFLLTERGASYSSMVAILYGGKVLHVNPGRTTGWKPLGTTFRVTKARGRRLYAVNGIPAYDLYDRFLKFPEEESFRNYAKEFPLMLRKGKMKLLRHPLVKYDDSSILLDGSVAEGDEICLSYGAPLEIIRKMNARCEKIRTFEPEAILLYSCQGRKNYWGDLINWEIEPFQKVAETGGACLDGQIMRNNQTGRVIEHRLTLLSIAMREGDVVGREIPPIEVDDEIILGKMSLVHRMSTLVESMVDELQRTNDALVGMNEQLARVNGELHRIAVTDELTGLYNRREIERRGKDALA